MTSEDNWRVCVEFQPNETKDRTAVFELALTCETQFHSPMCITRKVLVAVAPGASRTQRLGIKWGQQQVSER